MECDGQKWGVNPGLCRCGRTAHVPPHSPIHNGAGLTKQGRWSQVDKYFFILMGHSFSESTCGSVSYVLDEVHHRVLGSFVSVPLFWGLCLTQLLGLRPRRGHGEEGSTMLSAALMFPFPLLTERPENARSEVLDKR